MPGFFPPILWAATHNPLELAVEIGSVIETDFFSRLGDHQLSIVMQQLSGPVDSHLGFPAAEIFLDVDLEIAVNVLLGKI